MNSLFQKNDDSRRKSVGTPYRASAYLEITKSWQSLIILILLILFPFTALAQTPTSTPTFIEPSGCLRPSDDYTRVEVNGSQLSQRTLDMLAHAQTLYSGTIDLTGLAVTQGSYNAGHVSASFGTHDGGGAVDISVRNLPQDWSILWDEIPLVIEALRTAGFAAWFRNEEDDMTPHIHAIAIGDADLSRAAQLQLTGRYGYFRGFDGLPQEDGVPQTDQDGELILCQWMIDLGYRDLREETVITPPPYEIAIGDTVYTNTTWGEELNFRSDAGLKTQVITRLPSETAALVLDGPIYMGGLTWWQLQLDDGTIGWAVEKIENSWTLVK